MRGRKNAEKALAAVNGNMVDGRELAVDWAVDKEVWESQQKTAAASHEDGSDEESDGGDESEEKDDPDQECGR